MAPCAFSSRDRDRYSTVRTGLDKLGYDSPMTIDSLELVEKLLEDLVTTTSSLRRYKDVYRKTVEKCNLYEQGIEPYMKENSKLMKNCNDLHKRVLNLTDELDDQNRAHQKKVAILNSELERFRIMESQFNKCINELQNECAEKTIKLHKTVQPTSRPAFRPAGSANKAFPPLHVRMSKENARSSQRTTSSQNDLDKNFHFEPSSNILRVVEHQASNLSHELHNVRDQLKDLTLENSALQDKIRKRDVEINRMQGILEGGVPIKKVVLANTNSGNDREELKKLKSQLQESESQKHEAMRNAVRLMQKCDKLQQEMLDVDKLACEVQESKRDLEQRLAQCEDNFIKCCNENHDLKAQQLRMGRSQSSAGADQTARERKRLQENLDEMAKELSLKKDQEKKLVFEIKRLNDKLTSQNRTASRSQSACSKKSSVSGKDGFERNDLNQRFMEMEKQMEDLRDDRDRYKHHIKNLTDELAAQSDSRGINLVQQMSLKDKELAAIQQENSNLVREIANLNTQLLISQQSHSSTDLRALLTQAERAKNAAKEELFSAKAEIDTLKDQMIKQNNRWADGYTHVDSEQVLQLRCESRKLLQEKGSNMAHITNLEQQLRTVEAELTKQRTHYHQLKNLHEQAETSLAVCQGELRQLRSDAVSSQSRMSELKTLQAEVASLREERARFRAEIDQRSGASDNYKLELDEKSERIALLQKELNAKEVMISKLETNVAELKSVLQVTQDSDLANKHDSRGLQREVERLRKELDQATRVQKACEQENKRIQDDLSATLKDCKLSQKQLVIAQKEVEDLKERLQNYVSEVQRIEDLLSQKECDRNNLLEQFHSLSQEAVELETHNNSLKSETHQVKHSLEVTESQVSHLEQQLTSSQRLIFTYESQVTELARIVKDLEIELRSVKEQSETFEKDLNAVHELCMKLDSQKEALEDELKTSNRRSSELEAKCADMKSELDAMRYQLNQEVGTKGALESVLVESREENMKQRMTSEELAQELDKLKDDLSKMRQEHDRDDIGRYSRLVAEKSQEADALRRELTKEKFERVRMEEVAAHSSRMSQHKSSASSVHSLKSLSPETSD